MVRFCLEDGVGSSWSVVQSRESIIVLPCSLWECDCARVLVCPLLLLDWSGDRMRWRGVGGGGV